MRIFQSMSAIFVVLMLISFTAKSEEFNTAEVITHSSKGLQLGENEGYLYLSFRTNTDISRLTIDGIGFGNKIRFSDVKQGINHALLKVKAGEYYIEHINIFVGIGAVRSNLKADDHRFTVKPGVVNYPGSWDFEAEWVENLRAQMRLDSYNFLSLELVKFKQQFGQQLQDLKFVYQGAIEDPYTAYLDEALKDHGGTAALSSINFLDQPMTDWPMTVLTELTTTVSVDMKYPRIRDYFHYDEQTIRAVSPDEKHLLFSAVLGEVVTVGLIRVADFNTYVLYQQKLPENSRVSELSWVDRDSFFMTLSNRGEEHNYVAHLTMDSTANSIDARFVRFRITGELLAALPAVENTLFFQADQAVRSNHKNTLYRVDVTDDKSIQASFHKPHQPTRKLKDVVDWLVDPRGVVRAALAISYDKKAEQTDLHYWFLEDPTSNDWQEIRTVHGSENLIWLKSLSPDEQSFYVLTNEFNDKYAIHQYATADGSHMGVFHEDPDHDILNVLYDRSTHEIIGYTFLENGLLQAHYFKELDERFERARQDNPDVQLFQVQQLKTQQRLLLFGLTPSSKGAWYMLNQETGLADKIFDISPNYERLPKGIHHTLFTQTDDGVELEGFLVMPQLEEGQKAPLIVMPHGGPIGVQDMAHNNEVQHFLAAQGFATLRVNYRGSGGYGKEFQSMGNQQWGEKIEQDIHSMTQHAFATHPLDVSKTCAMGGSYGGYSALMLTYLYPETYLCAVSFAGVMDLPLLFTSRDLSKNPEMAEKLTEIVGDPINQINRLTEKSPVYLLKEMKRPFMLFQGMKDSRVRVEHAVRMQQLMTLYGMTHEVVLFENEGHSFSQKNTPLLYLDRSLKFLKKHMNLK